MIKIEEIREFVSHTVETNENTYTRHSSQCWTIVMGESEEPVYDCNELEKVYQEYISNTGIKRKDSIVEKWKGVIVHTPTYPDGAIMIKVDDNIERPIAIVPLPVGGHEKGTELQFCNASLIAASPELLDACEDALSFFTPDDDIYNTLFDVIVKAQRNFKSKKR